MIQQARVSFLSFWLGYSLMEWPFPQYKHTSWHSNSCALCLTFLFIRWTRVTRTPKVWSLLVKAFLQMVSTMSMMTTLEACLPLFGRTNSILCLTISDRIDSTRQERKPGFVCDFRLRRNWICSPFVLLGKRFCSKGHYKGRLGKPVNRWLVSFDVLAFPSSLLLNCSNRGRNLPLWKMWKDFLPEMGQSFYCILFPD